MRNNFQCHQKEVRGCSPPKPSETLVTVFGNGHTRETFHSIGTVGGLVRSIKTNEEIFIPGRGRGDSTLATWTLGRIHLQDISHEMENCVVSATTKQHIDQRDSRIVRDNADIEKIDNWFAKHDPFVQTTELIGPSTGLVADKRINCHLAREIGIPLVRELMWKSFDKISFQRKNKVCPLSMTSGCIDVDLINPFTILTRIGIVKNDSEDLKRYRTHWHHLHWHSSTSME